MKKILSALLLFLALPCLAFAKSTMPEDKNANMKDSQVLFVLLAKEASMKKSETSDVYDLSLKDVSKNVIYFSNRPERISGKLETKKFVKEWEDKGSFKQMAPNAMIEAVKMDTRTHQLQNKESSYAVTLNKPTYSADYKNVTFKVKALPGSTSLQSMNNSKYVAIFIDGICLTCIGG